MTPDMEQRLSFTKRLSAEPIQEIHRPGFKSLNLLFILPTSNLCKRLFKNAGYTLSKRQSLSRHRISKCNCFRTPNPAYPAYRRCTKPWNKKSFLGIISKKQFFNAKEFNIVNYYFCFDQEILFFGEKFRNKIRILFGRVCTACTW